jgi:hypothetical protein
MSGWCSVFCVPFMRESQSHEARSDRTKTTAKEVATLRKTRHCPQYSCPCLSLLLLHKFHRVHNRNQLINRAMSNNNTSKANAVTTKTTTKTVEDKIRQYAALFNGTERDFSVAEPIFNDVYHESFLGTVSRGGGIDKKAKRKLDEQRLAGS